MHEVLGALYVLRTLPREHNGVLAEQLKSMGYIRLYLMLMHLY